MLLLLLLLMVLVVVLLVVGDVRVGDGRRGLLLGVGGQRVGVELVAVEGVRGARELGLRGRVAERQVVAVVLVLVVHWGRVNVQVDA